MTDGTDAERRDALAEMFGATREPETTEAEPEPTDQPDQEAADVELLRRLHAEPEQQPVSESMARREQALSKANLPVALAPLLEDSEDSVQLFMAARELGRNLGVRRVSTEQAIIERDDGREAEWFRAKTGLEPGRATDPQPPQRRASSAPPIPSKAESQQRLVDLLHPPTKADEEGGDQ